MAGLQPEALFVVCVEARNHKSIIHAPWAYKAMFAVISRLKYTFENEGHGRLQRKTPNSHLPKMVAA